MTITHHHQDTGEVALHYVRAGSGDPVVLLHGWPQTWYAWRKIIPALAQHHTVIAPDLRGLGDSDRPLTGYDKRTIAGDVWRLVHDCLGFERFFLVGHDWGGPVAYAIAAEHPDAVRRLAMLDTGVPGDGSGTFSQHGRRWHHAFHQTADLPEGLIAGRESIYYGWFWDHYGWRPGAISPEDKAEYLRTYTQPGALRAGLAYYRAIEEDVRVNTASRLRARLPMPVLALGGAEAFGRGEETLTSMQRVASDVRGGVVDGCGHWMAEERPELIATGLLDFFAEDDRR